ncbi:synaptophysin-like isoform X3 [Lineus longissimus]|uniref:synaptophysin-like isoform X3 n=1 Tax=Lineus longissimus TaxID=88925 RepID=UPI002B4E5DBA
MNVIIVTLKIIFIIIAIFAFATTAGFSSYTEFTVQCTPGKPNDTKRISFSYPFMINQFSLKLPLCEGGNDTLKEVRPYGTYAAPSQFFVFVGVICFLYCIGAVVLYVFFDEAYRKNERIPQADFVISIVLSFFWLCGASAWAHGLSELKTYTQPHALAHHIEECQVTPSPCNLYYNTGNYAGLNVSIIFGFLNLIVWVGNLWFLFKETSWFIVRSKPPGDIETMPQQV